MKYILAVLAFIPFLATSQDVLDIVRFSETQVYGSARFESMAGSFGALGADLSTSSVNPAGYGRYSSSTFGMSFMNTSMTNKAGFNGMESFSKLNSFKLNNLGFVITNDVSEKNKGFVFSQVGFSYVRVQNFKDEFSYEGQQFSSLLDEFAGQASGLTVDEMYSNLPYTSALAWDTYTIDPDPDVTNGYIPRLGADDEVYHSRSVEAQGGISDYNLNISGNFMNKLYIGGALAIRSGKYTEDYYHRERVIDPDYSLDSFDYEYHLSTKGAGVNLKLGVIYLPTEQLRLGLSVHTPTFFNFKDNLSTNMIAYHMDTVYRIAEEWVPVNVNKFRLRTPPKVVGSVAYVFGTRGCINVDLEYVNYDFAHLRGTTDTLYTYYNYASENQESRQQLRSVLNVRVGGELVFNSQYFVRGGFSLYPSAYDRDLYKEQPDLAPKGTQIFSGGLGYRWKKSSIDLALRVEHRNYNYYAYSNSLTVVNSFKNGIILNYSLNF
ncbi:MAG: OmpP1/FadL family transporter [Bacteroidota bacterium]